MRIAIVRGDFANHWEIQNFLPLAKKHELTLFTGLNPISGQTDLPGIKVVRLPSPVDLNFGRINRWRMGILNRIFTDGHVLFDLENRLSGFDIAHCAETYYSYTQQCLEAKKRGLVKAVVSTVWENIPFNNEGIRGRKAFKKRAFLEMDKFLAVTKQAKEALVAEGCFSGKITVLRPGVDLKVFRPQRIKVYKNIRRAGGLKPLFAGRLVAEKGIWELVRVFGRISKSVPDLQLVVVGNGPLREKVEEYCRTLDLSVTFLGQVAYEDMPKIYSLADIFVHPVVGSDTWQEQYGMVLVEAMACGVPVVAVDNGAVAEVVDKGGLVVGAGQLEKTLVSLVKRPFKRQNLGKAGLKTAMAKYDRDKYARELERIYQEILRSQ